MAAAVRAALSFQKPSRLQQAQWSQSILAPCVGISARQHPGWPAPLLEPPYSPE